MSSYNRIIRKITLAFGDLFSSINCIRFNPDQSEEERFLVPIEYAAKEMYVRRLSDPDLSKKVQITLPRLSYEMTGLSYDSSRKQITNNKQFFQSGTTLTQMYTPVPYDFDFSLYIYTRNEEDGVADAVNEAIEIGRQAKLPVEISHFKVNGQNNWGRSNETISIVENARKEGIDVTIDQYPYTASSTNLGILLPDWVLADGQDSILARLKNPIIREQVRQHSISIIRKRGLKHFDYAYVALFKADTTYNGKNIREINKMRGHKDKAIDEAETIIQMMELGGAQMVYHGMGEKDVANIMRYPFNMAASDAGIAQMGVSRPHPRAYGTNARVLGKYVREDKVISLEEAIRRMTSLPANKFNLKERGLIKEGYFADIVVFNDKEVGDQASFENPHQFSKGFQYVIVNGAITIENGMHNGTRKGTAIRNNNL